MNTNNYCIVMAGGVGSRFWPVSTSQRPKQFLDFLGTGKSLLRMTVDRISSIVPRENIYIVTNEVYREECANILPEIPIENILCEPMRRNTAPCIAYASFKILALNKQANIIVLPSDHLIIDQTEFARVISEGLLFTSNNDALLTLGVRPTRPETGYGYIQMSSGENALRKVKTFTEKPNLQMAKLFIESGEFCWNSGMFLWKAEAICAALKKHLPDTAELFESNMNVFGTSGEIDMINTIYPQCQNISIDYGVMERADNVYVIEADFGWSDVGTWNSLYDIREHDENGNAIIGCDSLLYNSTNNIVALPEGNIAVVDGLDGYLIAYDNNALLICHKEDEAKIRGFVNDVKQKNERFV